VALFAAALRYYSRVRGLRVLVVATLASCYSPALPEDQACSPTDGCPEGLTCDVASKTCVSELPEAARFTKLSTSYEHTCAIDAEGALWCWGRNDQGELGVGDQKIRLVPTRVGGSNDWQHVSAGEEMTCGIRAGDSLWCWGEDLSGMNRPALLPTQVAGAWRTVAAGHQAYCAIGVDGAMSCRRYQTMLTPAGLPATIQPVSVSTTHDLTCVIDAQQQLHCFGLNNSGQAGTGTRDPVDVATPHQIPGAWQSVSVSDLHACALAASGAMSCWGECGWGQLGRSCSTPGAPVVVDDRTYLSVSTGVNHTCAVRDDGAMVCFGDNTGGQLGSLGGLPLTRRPTAIVGFDGWTTAAAGILHSCGLRADGEAWCWGINSSGQLGDGGGGVAYAPVPIDVGPWTTVNVSRGTACAIRGDGSLWCWGSNGVGQVGDGSLYERRRPVQVGTEHDWIAVANAQAVTCGIRAPGTLWCWGSNDREQLAVGDVVEGSAVPLQIGAASGWTEVALTDRKACGILAGSLMCWGNGVITPTPPPGMSRAMTSLRGHNGGFLALEAGRAYGWSSNDPTTTPRDSITDWSTVDLGRDHSCGLRGDAVWCLGQNYNGQLGSDEIDPLVLTQEATLASWSSVDVGGNATCAIATDGHLACWGIATMIGIGQGQNQVDRATTVGSAAWTAISLGETDVCGIQGDGSLHCWGSGSFGVRGDGRGGHERPTRVAPP